MTEPVTLAQAKAHLRLRASVTDEDIYVAGLITAARRKIELATRRSFSGTTPTLTGDDAALAVQAILLTVGTWYGNREASTPDARSAPAELPLTVSWILDDLRKWDDGSC